MIYYNFNDFLKLPVRMRSESAISNRLRFYCFQEKLLVVIKYSIKMSFKGGGKVQKMMVQPIVSLGA